MLRVCDAGSRQALADIVQLVNQAATTAGRPHKTVEEVALGFIDVANEAMCRPIRALTEARGFDVSQHVLACFGGAGGQHACAIARQLGMKTVFVHRYASILSAVGMGLASVVQEAQVRRSTTYLLSRDPELLLHHNGASALIGTHCCLDVLLDKFITPGCKTGKGCLACLYHL